MRTPAHPFLVDDALSAEEWDDFVRSVEGGHHTQTTAWASVRSQLGAEFSRFALRREGTIIASLQAFTVDVPLVGKSIVGVAGPQFADDALLSRSAFVEQFVRWAWGHGTKAILLQAQHTDPALDNALLSHGFRPSPVSPQLAATAVIDLRRSEESIFAAMTPKARYNIRKGLRRGVEVVEARDEGPAILSGLLTATAHRQGFSRPMSERELRLLITTMNSDPDARIFLARVNDQVLSGALIIGFGQTALYKRGAWSGQRSDLHPNEVMHGHIIEWARTAGYTRYDLDGMNANVAAAILRGDPVSPSGVTRFKLKLGAEPRLRPEAMILFRRPHLRALTRLSAIFPRPMTERITDGLRRRL